MLPWMNQFEIVEIHSQPKYESWVTVVSLLFVQGSLIQDGWLTAIIYSNLFGAMTWYWIEFCYVPKVKYFFSTPLHLMQSKINKQHAAETIFIAMNDNLINKDTWTGVIFMHIAPIIYRAEWNANVTCEQCKHSQRSKVTCTQWR